MGNTQSRFQMHNSLTNGPYLIAIISEINQRYQNATRISMCLCQIKRLVQLGLGLRISGHSGRSNSGIIEADYLIQRVNLSPDRWYTKSLMLRKYKTILAPADPNIIHRQLNS